MNRVLGGSALGEIGFTVPLFIAGLAFTSATSQSRAESGILVRSPLAALAGVALLRRQPASPRADVSPADERPTT